MLGYTKPSQVEIFNLSDNLSNYKFIILVSAWDNSQIKIIQTIPYDLIMLRRGAKFILNDGSNSISIRYDTDNTIKVEESSNPTYYGVYIYGSNRILL